MSMYLFKAQIRGNVKRADEDSLQADIAEGLASIPYFTLTENTVSICEMGGGELWTEEDESGNTLYLFAITIAGEIYAESEAAVRAFVSNFCKAYPDFVLVYRRIRATGIEYKEPDAAAGEAEAEEGVVEEAAGATDAAESAEAEAEEEAGEES